MLLLFCLAHVLLTNAAQVGCPNDQEGKVNHALWMEGWVLLFLNVLPEDASCKPSSLRSLQTAKMTRDSPRIKTRVNCNWVDPSQTNVSIFTLPHHSNCLMARGKQTRPKINKFLLKKVRHERKQMPLRLVRYGKSGSNLMKYSLNIP